MIPPSFARAGGLALVPAFDPVRLRYRRDGWAPDRQIAFIAELRACRCVLEACRRVGLSSESAYKLYRRADAASFRRAWDAALAGPRPPRPPRAAGTSATASVSSTSGGGAEIDGKCRDRRLHQLPRAAAPPDRQLPAAPPPPRPRPAYSLEAFRRMVAGRRLPGR